MNEDVRKCRLHIYTTHSLIFKPSITTGQNLRWIVINFKSLMRTRLIAQEGSGIERLVKTR